MTMSKQEESKLSDKIEKYAREHRIYQIDRTQGGTTSGKPDRTFLYKGVYIGAELKTPTGKPTELQKRKLKAINENGGIGRFITSLTDFKDVIRYINILEGGKL